MAGSIATETRRRPQSQTASWVHGLGRVFRRVALFHVDGTTAKIASVHGMGPPRLGAGISLIDETPLRWAVAAASPIVGAGSAPGGATIAAAMGLSTPRAYAVIPLVSQGRLHALAYVDQANEALPLSAASELFAFCDQVLREGAKPPKPPRYGHRSTRRGRRVRTPGLVRHLEIAPEPAIDPMVEAAAQRALLDLPEELEPELARNFAEPELCEYTLEEDEWHEPPRATPPPIPPDARSEPPPPPPQAEPPPPPQAEPPPLPAQTHRASLRELAKDGDVVVTPDGVVSTGKHAAVKPRRRRRYLAILAAAVVALGGLAAVAITPLSPVESSEAGFRLVQIPREASVPQIAEHLQTAGVIRSARAFRLLARVTGTDRSLRAGAYRLSTGAWTQTVLEELHQGQVHTRTFTVPEGLTLMEVAHLIEQEGLARATDILREAYSPGLLAQYGIPASNVEGYLFPETYTLAKGLSAREILTVMLDEFRVRLTNLAAGSDLDAEELHQKIILASIVEREARDHAEYAKVAGVFDNRIERNMRLESCATVQYILGEPKARLTYADVRRESPYNTYLSPGLPPGPISNPGVTALDAALLPEKHDFLFFFAREDGTHKHVFSRTFATHKERQRRMRARNKR